MLKKLGYSRSGYYSWLNRKPSKQAIRKKKIKRKIMYLYNDSYQTYGAPKICKQLRNRDILISERTVGKYMKEMNIKACWVRPYTATTINSNFDNKLKNILKQEFNPVRPNAVWCTDITYIWTAEGFVYLTSIMDLFSRKIIAWTLSKTLEVPAVIDTVNTAKGRRNITKPLIIHSDRGCQYVSKAYKEATKRMKLSYSKKGYPYDNACIESFHALIKREWLNRFKIKDYNDARSLIFEYIETFYNTRRIHSHNNFFSPLEAEKKYYDSLEKRAAKIAV